MSIKITKIVWDSHLNIIERVTEPYDGPWALTKGEASKTEQAAADAQRQRENDLTAGQLAMQQSQLMGVNSTIDPIINSIVQGQTPPVLQPLESSLTASYMNQIPAQFRALQGGINNALVARGITGGQNAGSGDIARNFGQLGAMQAALQQQGATNTAMTMNQQRLGMLQNDLGLKLGIANQYGGNIGTFNSGASNALNSGVTAANNVDQAQTSWMGPVFGALGGMGSSLITGGMSNMGKGTGFFGCWIARAVYGDESPFAEFVRERLWQRAAREWKFNLLMRVYMKYGEFVAKLVKKSSLLSRAFKYIFDKFLDSEMCKVN